MASVKMDQQKRQMLQAYQKEIVQDLDVKDIMDVLFTNQVVSSDVYDNLLSNLANRAENTRYLLDTLMQSGSNQSFEGFVDSLSKDYRWLWEKFSIPEISHQDPVFNESFEDSLSRGDVPRLPEHYVPRAQQENEIVTKLTELTRHGTLVLHGMSGSGKTSIAIAILRNNPHLVTDRFGAAVFWLNLGNCRTEDDIVLQQIKLYRKASSIFSHHGSTVFTPSISMSSIGSNMDSQSIMSLEQTWQDYRDLLKGIFSENALKEALLVLDDVNERSVAEAFDIGCKLMVTTRDRNAVAVFSPKFFPIENSFTEAESISLFASCLDMPASQLPRQARKLHEICKGGPFLIALLGAHLAENRERLRHDPNYWNYYVDKLSKKDILSLMYRRDHTDPTLPVKMCINSLPAHILPLFKKLAVLPDNVKVSAKVLSTLWGENDNKVQNMMRQLRSKSLIIQHYVQEERNYLYEVHDLILSVLRSMHSADEMRKLHIEILKQYRFLDVTNTSIQLIDDGYIAFYIAYHIFHTGNTNNEWSLFNKLYLNLKFLGNKIKLTGQADVISDLKNYEEKICRIDLDLVLLRDIESYLGAHGNDLHRYPLTDIVQSVLQHTSHGALYAKAYQLAQDASAQNELYFEFLHEQNVEEAKYTSIDINNGVGSVCFLGNYVLVGLQTGKIQIFNTHTYRMVKELENSTAGVTWLSACPVNACKVATLDAEGTIRVWSIGDLEPAHSDVGEDLLEEEAEEAELCSSCDSHTAIDNKHGAHINCRWAHNTELLVAHTNKKIISYSTDGIALKVYDNWDHNREIVCCALSNDDRALIVGSSTKNEHYVEIYDVKNKERLTRSNQGKQMLQILNVPNSSNCVLGLSKNEVVKHSWYSLSPLFTPLQHHTYNMQSIINSESLKESLEFVSAAVNKGGSLLFVSTNDSRVICIDLSTDAHILDLLNRRGNIISMDVSELWYEDFVSHYDVLVTGTDEVENSIKVWHLDTAYVAVASNKHRKARLTSKFDASFHQGLISSPQTSMGRITPNSDRSVPSSSTPRRINSFASARETDKRPIKKTISLDRHSIKPLNLKGIMNGNEENGVQPLLAVVDDKNNVQIMRGRRVFVEIAAKPEETITAVQISPCNKYILLGLKTGTVKKFVMRSKETITIMDINSPVQFLEFVTPQLLLVSGKNRCLMAYMISCAGDWQLEMLLQGNTNLGSQEILSEIIGTKKLKYAQSDAHSSSSEGSTVSPQNRLFHTESRLCKSSALVGAFWIDNIGLLTVEDNATVKLWDLALKLELVLSGRQAEVIVTCAAFHNMILALCDEFGKFQTFQLKLSSDGSLRLQTLQENKVNNKITVCNLTGNGYILAMGLDNGNIVLWNVQAKYQIALLKHHKTSIQTLFFSPVPDSMNTTGGGGCTSPLVATSPFAFTSSSHDTSGEESDVTPLVLVSMAAEIVWWNITHVIKIKQRQTKPRNSKNILTPILQSPNESRVSGLNLEGIHISPNNNHFFGDAPVTTEESWEVLWKGKRCKCTSKRRDILACVKLCGVSARKLLADDKFTCFVTVDSSGAIHVMHLMRPPQVT